MKIIYILRVVIISFEAVILLLASVFIMNFDGYAYAVAKRLSIDGDFLNYLVLLPALSFGWVLKESKDLVFADVQTTTVLVNWHDYWKLKIHIFVCLFFSLIFFCIAAIPWLNRSRILDGKGLILFGAGLIGSVWVAATVYFAQMTVKEILATEYRSLS